MPPQAHFRTIQQQLASSFGRTFAKPIGIGIAIAIARATATPTECASKIAIANAISLMNWNKINWIVQKVNCKLDS